MNTKVEERRKMGGRGFKRVPILALITVAIAMFAMSARSYAAGSEEDIPATSIVPSTGDSAPASSKSPAAANAASSAGAPTTAAPVVRAKPATHHRHAAPSIGEPEVE